ncbi:MAG: hypothetical protein LUC33_01585 [Prevotellaceae bacterium]|nr:hypothetical protein [Prevotellaceae bacterium]
MSWYQINSVSIWGNKVEIDIYPSGCDTSKDPVQLKAAAEPFDMETDDSTEIDTTIRETTGTVRFIVEDEGVLDEILPSTPFDTRVQVWLTETASRERNNMFSGYVEMSEYSQPWDTTPYEFELPVKDVLCMLSLVNVEVKDDTDFAGIHTFAYYIKEAITATGYEVGEVCINAGTNYNNDILTERIQREWFISEETEEKNGVTTYYAQGITWHDAIERVLKANAMTMTLLPKGRLLLQSCAAAGGGVAYGWDQLDEFDSGTPAATNIAGDDSTLSFEDELVCMSNSNEIDWVLPLRRILVTQKLDKRKLFELSDNWHSNWWMESYGISTNSDGTAVTAYDFTLFRATSTQRGVTMEHWYNSPVDDESTRKDIDDFQFGTLNKAITSFTDKDEGTSYNVFGCLLGSMDTFGSSGVGSKTSITSPSPQLIILGQALPSHENENKVVATFVSPVILTTDRPGMICIKPGNLNFYNTSSVSNDLYTLIGINGKEYTPGRHPVLYYSLALEYQGEYARVNLRGYTFNRLVCIYKEGVWVKCRSIAEDNSDWDYSSQEQRYTTGWIFDGNELAPNNEDWHDNDFKGYTEPNSTSKAKRYGFSFVGAQERMLYKDGDGFFYPFSVDAGIPAGEYRLVFRLHYFVQRTYAAIHSNVVGSDESIENVVAILDGLTISFAPRCYDGLLDGSAKGLYWDLPTEKTTVFDCAGSDGTEDETIDLDSWKDDITFTYAKDGDGNVLTFKGKDNRSVQPALPVYNSAAAAQWKKARRKLTYDDAKGEFSISQKYQETGSTVKYKPLAFGWKASNEGGKKVFLEELQL